jgi:hypothetical protein
VAFLTCETSLSSPWRLVDLFLFLASSTGGGGGGSILRCRSTGLAPSPQHTLQQAAPGDGEYGNCTLSLPPFPSGWPSFFMVMQAPPLLRTKFSLSSGLGTHYSIPLPETSSHYLS